MQITESLQTPVAEYCDVLVCGGGFAGISAALAAVRQGKRVTLLEKQYILGGLGTAGLITIYLPLCDGMGRQVSFGIAEEMLRLSISMGAEDRYPANWLDNDDPAGRTSGDPRFLAAYNGNLFAMLAEQQLLREGVKILYGAYAVRVSKEAARIKAVIIEGKTGRQAIGIRTVVDATGDCDIAHFAGAPTRIYQAGNTLAAWYYALGQEGYRLRQLGFADIPDQGDLRQKGASVLGSHRYTGLDTEELSQMVIASHSASLADIRSRRKTDHALIPTCLASIPQIRMSRRLQGVHTFSDNRPHAHTQNSVGMVSDWRTRGPVYEVPFTALYCKEVRNLITAGRCISVTDGMWDIMRVIPCCAVTGQAAGTAAAMTDDFSLLDTAALQQRLRQQGVVIHEAEL